MPDFYIVGAMKCGTTTIHHILSQHPNIFIPPGEVNLFTIDDPEEFPQAQWDGTFREQNLKTFFPEYSHWHASLFSNARQDQIKGEDSATYLSSRRAIERIASHAPNAKLIVSLRDPVERTWSQYGHWVSTGRAMLSFEDTIRFDHGNLLRRSYYEDSLRHCLSIFPRSQIFILAFEQFIQDQSKVSSELMRFLGQDPHLIPVADRHHNPTRHPRFLRLKLTANFLLRRSFATSYRNRIPRLRSTTAIPVPTRITRTVLSRINPLRPGIKRQMKPETRTWLSSLMRSRNSGLEELVQINLRDYWPSFRD